jgi:hypothetical protein
LPYFDENNILKCTHSYKLFPIFSVKKIEKYQKFLQNTEKPSEIPRISFLDLLNDIYESELKNSYQKSYTGEIKEYVKKISHNWFNLDELIKFFHSFDGYTRTLAYNHYQIVENTLFHIRNHKKLQFVLADDKFGKTAVLEDIFRHSKKNGYSTYYHKSKIFQKNPLALVDEVLKFLIFLDLEKFKNKASDFLLFYSVKKNLLKADIQGSYFHAYEDKLLLFDDLLYYLTEFFKDDEFILIIDDISYFSDDEYRFLFRLLNGFNTSKLKIISSISIRKQYLIEKWFSYVDYLSHFLEPFPKEKIIDLVEEFFPEELDEKNLIADYIFSRSNGNPYNTSIILNWCIHENYLLDGNGKVNLPNIHYINEFKDIDFLFYKKFEKYKKYREILVFFVFISKPITLSLLQKVFSSGSNLGKILNRLRNDFILTFEISIESGFHISSNVVKETILEHENSSLVMSVIEQFSSIHELDEYFDYNRAAEYLGKSGYSMKAVEFFFHLGNVFFNHKEYFRAFEIFIRAQEILEKSTDSNYQTLKISIILKIAEASFLLKNFAVAHTYYLKYAQFYPKKNEPILKLFESNLRMNKLHDAEKMLDDKKIKSVLGNRNHPHFYHFKFLIALYHSNKSEYKEASDELLEILDADLEQELFYNSAILFLKVLNKLKETILISKKLIPALSENKSNLSDYHYLRIKLRAAEIFFNFQKFSEAKESFGEIINLSKHLLNKRVLAATYGYLGTIANLENRNSDASNYLKASMNFYSDIADKFKSAHYASNLAGIYRDLGYIHQAVETERIAYDYFMQTKNYSEVIHSISNIAHNYILVFNYSKAERFIDEAYRLSTSLQLKDGLFQTLLLRSVIHLKQQNIHKAKIDLTNAGNILPTEDPLSHLHYIYYKANFYSETKKFSEAKELALQAFSFPLVTEYTRYRYIFSYLLAKIMLGLGDLKSAEQLIFSSIDKTKKAENNVYLLYNYFLLWEIQKNNEEQRNYLRSFILKLISQVEENIYDEIIRATFIESNEVSSFLAEID